MKNQKFTIALILVAVLSIITNATFAQMDKPMPLHLIAPSVFPSQPYGVDAVIPSGAFDYYQVSTGAGFAETDICVNPLNPLNFVATDNRITGFSGARYIYYTLDGGVTWTATTSGITSNQGDPAFSADTAGNFYCMTLNPAVNGFIVYKSANGGATWTSVAFLPGGGVSAIDKEWIACDQTNGVYKNNVYMAFVNFTSGATCAFMRSTNNGASWSLVSGNLGSGTPNPGPDLCVNNQGKVYVGWYNGAGTSVCSSTDGGATFGAAVNASAHSQPGTFNSGAGRYVVKNLIRINGMPHLAVDNSNGPFKGNVYCMYNSNPPGPDAADIYLTRTTDGGATWSMGSPVRVNDDAPGVACDQWMGDVSVDAQGKVWVMFWDSRNDPNNVLTEQWAAVSTDGGQTFMPNFRACGTNFDPNSGSVHIFQTNHYYVGDYQGMSGKTFTLPFYVGPGNSLNDFTSYLPDYGISFKKSVDSISQNGYGVNVVRAPMMGPFSGAVTYSASISPSPSPGTINFTWLPGNVKNFTGAPDSLSLQAVVSSNVPMATYTVTVTAVQNGGPRTHNRTYNILVGNFTGISQHGSDIPQAYQLSQNFPNPFNPSTVIYYSIPKQELVNLRVYDILGREVEALVKDQLQNPSEYQVTFDASKLTSGIYYYKLTAGEFSDVRKMVLIK